MKEDNKEKVHNIKVEGEEPETERTSAAGTGKEAKADHDEKESQENKGQEEPAKEDEQGVAKQQLAELKDKYLRLRAEFDNYKKRTLKEKADLILNGGEKTVTALLPVLDDLERAMADKSDDPKAIKEGVKNIHNKFVKSLEAIGVKTIDTKDKDFDTDYHEAVAMVPGLGDDKKGKVIDCLQTGYTLNDKVIRHAKVAVGQ